MTLTFLNNLSTLIFYKYLFWNKSHRFFFITNNWFLAQFFLTKKLIQFCNSNSLFVFSKTKKTLYYTRYWRQFFRINKLNRRTFSLKFKYLNLFWLTQKFSSSKNILYSSNNFNKINFIESYSNFKMSKNIHYIVGLKISPFSREFKWRKKWKYTHYKIFGKINRLHKRHRWARRLAKIENDAAPINFNLKRIEKTNHGKKFIKKITKITTRYENNNKLMYFNSLFYFIKLKIKYRQFKYVARIKRGPYPIHVTPFKFKTPYFFLHIKRPFIKKAPAPLKRTISLFKFYRKFFRIFKRYHYRTKYRIKNKLRYLSLYNYKGKIKKYYLYNLKTFNYLNFFKSRNIFKLYILSNVHNLQNYPIKSKIQRRFLIYSRKIFKTKISNVIYFFKPWGYLFFKSYRGVRLLLCINIKFKRRKKRRTRKLWRINFKTIQLANIIKNVTNPWNYLSPQFVLNFRNMPIFLETNAWRRSKILRLILKFKAKFLIRKFLPLGTYKKNLWFKSEFFTTFKTNITGFLFLTNNLKIKTFTGRRPRLFKFRRGIYSFSKRNDLPKHILKKYSFFKFTNTLKSYFRKKRTYRTKFRVPGLKSQHTNYLSQLDSLDTAPSTNLINVAYPFFNSYSHSLFMFRTRLRKGTRKKFDNLFLFRLKPGYMRIWRRARRDLLYRLPLSFKYQHQLTSYLVTFKGLSRFQSYTLNELRLENILMRSRLILETSVAFVLINNSNIFVNGYSCTNRFFVLFTNDFVQLIISFKYYITFRWLLNRTLKLRHRIKQFASRRKKKIKLQKPEKYYNKNIPLWVSPYKNLFLDIAKYLEVDFFTLSIFVLYDPFRFNQINHYNYTVDKHKIYNMYNWKYIT